MAQDLTGMRFGRLVVIERYRGKSNAKVHTTWWRCKCDCGMEIVTGRTYLVRGSTKSCGCLRSEKSSEMMQKIRQRRWAYVNHA